MNRTGKIVDYCDILYELSSEEDAIGFVKCCDRSGGQPGPCAIEWRCISKKKKVNEKDSGPER